GMEDVEAAGSERELHSLDVDDDFVAECDGPGEARIGDARSFVHLEAHEAFQPFRYGRDGAPPQAKHAGRARRARACPLACARDPVRRSARSQCAPASYRWIGCGW